MPYSTRRCPRCGDRFPLDREHFYVRPGNGQAEYCTAPLANGCHESYWETVRERRRLSRGGSTSLLPVADRKFGVEIETTSGRGARVSITIDLQALGIQAQHGGYFNPASRPWHVKSEHCGSEIVSPPLQGQAGLDELKAVCGVLSRNSASVNIACGLHVHHDVSDLDASQFKRLFKIWSQNESLIELLVAHSRRQGDYCGRLRERDVEAIDEIDDMTRDVVNRKTVRVGRYRSLNVRSYGLHGTVEVRLHQGTADYRKISAWVKFGQAMIELAKSKTEVSDLKFEALGDLLEAAPLDAQTREYLTRRAATLARPARRAYSYA